VSGGIGKLETTAIDAEDADARSGDSGDRTNCATHQLGDQLSRTITEAESCDVEKKMESGKKR